MFVDSLSTFSRDSSEVLWASYGQSIDFSRILRDSSGILRDSLGFDGILGRFSWILEGFHGQSIDFSRIL